MPPGLTALLFSALATASAFPLSCAPGTYLGCFNDSARPVPILLSPPSGDTALALPTCALFCAADGYPVFAVTARPGAAYCYCGAALNPASARAPEALCAVPCPGAPSERCGGEGVSVVYASACDAPLPPPALGAGGAPQPSPACSSPASAAWPFCDATLPVEARLDDLVARIAVTEVGPQLTARLSPAIPRLGMAPFMWGTNAIHGITDYAGCRPSGVCPSTWGNGVSLGAGWNASTWRELGATTGIELRAYDNIQWRQDAATGSGPVGGLISWGPTINIQRDARWGRTMEVR